MGSDSHRKHHRSPSDDESAENSKRHKHRHHRHRRSKHDDVKKDENKDQVVVDDIVTKKPLVDYDYDMEEGEIVEEDEVEGSIAGNNKIVGSSDVESGEFKAGDAPSDFDGSFMSVDAGTSRKSPGNDQSGESKEGGSQSHHDELPVLERITNGDLASRSSKGESRLHSRHKPPRKESRKEKERHRGRSKKPVLDVMEVDDDEDRGDRRNSHPQKVGEASGARNHIETASDTSRSESPDRRRERSQSILHDVHFKARHCHERDDGKVGYDVDDESNDRGQKAKDIGTQRGSSYHMSSAREGKYEDSWDKGTQEKMYQDKKGVDREQSKERSERYLDRNGEKERHSYRSRDREREKDFFRDRDWPRETKSDVDRERNRDGSRDWDLDKERDRRREKDHGRSRDRDFDWERRRDDSVSVYRDKDKERDRARDRSRKLEIELGRDRYSDRDRHRDKARDDEDDRSRRYHKYDDRDDGYGSGDSRRSYEKAEHGKDRRTKRDPEKYQASKVDSQKKKEDGARDDDDYSNDHPETLELKRVEQEEEDVDRIKEESRRRREAILQKYKAKQLQQQQQSVPMVPKVSDEQLPQNLASVNAFREESNGMKGNGNFSLVNDSLGVERSTVVLGEGSPKSEKSNDMFCDDIFGDSPAGVRKTGKGDGLPLERSGLHDNWDDPEGYYSFRFGEILDSHYEITAAHGKGVFSTVVRAKDLKAGMGDPEEVAIKIIRNNETMLKAGTEELVILKKLVGADPEDRRHCVRYLSHFKYRNHLCIVFESLHMNLREVLKKFGRNIGLKLTAVRTYAKQLFISLKHLRNCGVLHCDIKPDNMLVNDSKTVLKLCDFGNAMFAGKNEITPYLVSRFYRAPEIILGLPYDHPMDIWSVGCCLYELYTGKVLFPGPSNNDMLRLHMELKGHFPKKMLRKGAFIEQHFDQDLNFLAVEEDPVTKKAIRRLLVNIKPKDIGNIIRGSAGEDPKMLANFKDLLDKIFVLDPDKRLTVSQALNHPFITGK